MGTEKGEKDLEVKETGGRDKLKTKKTGWRTEERRRKKDRWERRREKERRGDCGKTVVREIVLSAVASFVTPV